MEKIFLWILLLSWRQWCWCWWVLTEKLQLCKNFSLEMLYEVFSNYLKLKLVGLIWMLPWDKSCKQTLAVHVGTWLNQKQRGIDNANRTISGFIQLQNQTAINNVNHSWTIFLISGKISLPDWDVESTGQKVAIPADVFLNHVANLHCEADGGNQVV